MEKLYLITGEEIYERNECLEKIKQDFGEIVKGINYIVLDKDGVPNLKNEINTCSFGFEKKLIIVKLDKKDEEEKVEWLSDALQETLASLNETVCVVFTGDFASNSKIYKLVSKYGKCFNFEKKKENELATWCKDLFEEASVIISNSDILYLVNLCGTEKIVLKNEVEKLVNYSKNIKKEDIDKLCIKSSDVIIFDLTDSLGSKNKKKALICLNELIENKEPIQKIAIMIAKHFKSLLIAKVAIENGKNVLNELSTKSSYAANKYKEQSKYFSKQELITWIKSLAKLDIDSKAGKIDLKIGLEKLICEN